MSTRPFRSASGTRPTLEGAGVRLHHALGFSEPSLTDPVLPVGRMHGLQLRADLPGALTMSSPRCRDVAGSEIPELVDDDGIAADPPYLDISVPPGTREVVPVDAYRSAFAYVFEGAASFRDAADPLGVPVEKEVAGREVHLRDRSGNRTLAQFDSGDEIAVQAADEGVRSLLVSGEPIREPVACHGPIVMNIEAELGEAMRDLERNTFVKESAA